MQNPLISDISPFRMYGNLYFVGSTAVCVHIIDTGNGLIMLDTGYPYMFDQIVYSMKQLNLDPKDLIAIFVSHGHYDHFGNVREFQALSGAKSYISRIDNKIVNGTHGAEWISKRTNKPLEEIENGEYDLSWAKHLGYEMLPFFDCDVLIDDGDTFTFGNTTIRCVLTPGHTDGTMSFFVNVEENGKSITAAMHGGAGTNTFSKKFLNRYNLPVEKTRDGFIQSLHDLASEKVDLFIGNHPGQNNTLGKLYRILAGETSVVDPTEWNRFLDVTEKNLLEFMKKEAAEEVATGK